MNIPPLRDEEQVKQTLQSVSKVLEDLSIRPTRRVVIDAGPYRGSEMIVPVTYTRWQAFRRTLRAFWRALTKGQ